jgi:hypothetical protein
MELASCPRKETVIAPWAPDRNMTMDKTSPTDLLLNPQGPRRTQDEVLRDIKVALATGGSNYGRGWRQQGSNPYDSELGRSPRDVWGRKR